MRVAIRFPKTRWGGLRSQTVVRFSLADLELLRAVDLGELVWRHGLQARASENVPCWRWWLRVWTGLGERMPVVWPSAS